MIGLSYVDCDPKRTSMGLSMADLFFVYDALVTKRCPKQYTVDRSSTEGHVRSTVSKSF